MRLVLHLFAGLSAVIAGAAVVQAVLWMAGNDRIDIVADLTRLVAAAFSCSPLLLNCSRC